MLTTELSLDWDFVIDTESQTNVPKFYVIVPIFIGVFVFSHGTVCQFMNENMENLIHFTVETHCDLPPFVRVVSDGTFHAKETCDGNTPFQHVKLFIVRFD
jgi:hypothetical protein